MTDRMRQVATGAIVAALALGAGTALILPGVWAPAASALVGLAMPMCVGHGLRRALPSAALTAAAALVMDLVVVYVVGAGYPEVRSFRLTPWYPPAVAAVLAVLAARDHA